ncbi:hydrogenase [Rhizobium etli]
MVSAIEASDLMLLKVKRVLTHLGSAVRVLDAEEARAIDDALSGIAEAVEGRAFESHFADLLSREPELPLHLRDRVTHIAAEAKNSFRDQRN